MRARIASAFCCVLFCVIEIHIRQAELRDAPVIAEFNTRLAAETEALRLDPECICAGVDELLRDPAKGFYFVAECRGEIAGINDHLRVERLAKWKPLVASKCLRA